MHEWPVNYASYARGYRVWWALISARRPFSFFRPRLQGAASRLQPCRCSLLACKYRGRERERERELGKENCSTTLVVTPLTEAHDFLSISRRLVTLFSRHLQFPPRVFPLPPSFFPSSFTSLLSASLPKCWKDTETPRFACGSPDR